MLTPKKGDKPRKEHFEEDIKALAEEFKQKQAKGVKGYLQMEALVASAANPKAKAFYKYILENGASPKTTKLTKTEQKTVTRFLRDAGISPKIKECYYNAQMLNLVSRGRLKYHEGWAQGAGLIAVPHAWNSLNGKIVDTTWGARGEIKTADRFSAMEGDEYFGITIPHNIVRRELFAKEMASPILRTYVIGDKLKQEKLENLRAWSIF